jgi:hypothetical protein
VGLSLAVLRRRKQRRFPDPFLSAGPLPAASPRPLAGAHPPHYLLIVERRLRFDLFLAGLRARLTGAKRERLFVITLEEHHHDRAN